MYLDDVTVPNVIVCEVGLEKSLKNLVDVPSWLVTPPNTAFEWPDEMSDGCCQIAPHLDEGGTKSVLCKNEEDCDVKYTNVGTKLASIVSSPRPQAVLTLLNSGDSSCLDESSGDSSSQKGRRAKGSCVQLHPKPHSEFVDSVWNCGYVCVWLYKKSKTYLRGFVYKPTYCSRLTDSWYVST